MTGSVVTVIRRFHAGFKTKVAAVQEPVAAVRFQHPPAA
ncbi:hypothetical protein U724_21565 [Pseudomonas chlororaphis subsp. aurantiaca PB-St2]|nr:hypothetical protein U724_21565 [Pseudomonas chlororaphis subsp. aurantiaca PB-St2]